MAVQGRWGAKNEKTRKTLRNCMVSLLRSNIQDFVQEVPVCYILYTMVYIYPIL